MDPVQPAQGDSLNEDPSLQSILRSILGTAQDEGDLTAEKPSTSVTAAAAASLSPADHDSGTQNRPANKNDVLGKNPLEVAFFRFLHSELQKCIRFYDQTQEEYTIRVERLVEGSVILHDPNSILVRDKWSVLARSAYNVYKDLLLLQNYAIMTYCSFSKILKKHDKVTGRKTRGAFMTSMVDPANFANTNRLEQMVQSCEEVYNEASERLFMEGRAVLDEDERLFLNMVSQMNNQAVIAAEEEGAPNASCQRRRGLKVHFDDDDAKLPQNEVGDSMEKMSSNRDSSPSGRSIFSSSGDDDSTTNGDQDSKPTAEARKLLLR